MRQIQSSLWVTLEYTTWYLRHSVKSGTSKTLVIFHTQARYFRSNPPDSSLHHSPENLLKPILITFRIPSGWYELDKSLIFQTQNWPIHLFRIIYFFFYYNVLMQKKVFIQMNKENNCTKCIDKVGRTSKWSKFSPTKGKHTHTCHNVSKAWCQICSQM